MNGAAAQTGVDIMDLWMGGVAENPAPFGSMVGPTFNYVFERQLENLQNEDRFYYLERLDGLNLLSQLEANSFQELIQRNTAAVGMPQDVFARQDIVLNLARIGGPGNTLQDDPNTAFNELELVSSGELTRTGDGMFRYSGGLHLVWNGSEDADRLISSIGDDSIAGNGGNDYIEGGAGNDLVTGGEGNDIIVDVFGDDVLKGGPGDDAINGGRGPADLLQGNEGNDFILGGMDASEIFGGPGNDVFYMGYGLSESVGGAGDDWFEGTTSPASIGIGDDNNQFQDDPNGGHDVGVAGPGDMDFDMEGGDDIIVFTVVPTHRGEGMLGFDWVTYRGETMTVDADMLVTGVLDVNAPLNEVRDRFDLVEGLSGSGQNDVLRGDDRLEADLRNDVLTGVANGHVLTAAGVARIDGLAALLAPGATEFAGGNIILGGAGSDIIEGRGGDDILDGDAWLNVQLRAMANDGTVRRADSLQELRSEVFAGLISPSTITIERSIVRAPGGADIDTAVFSGARSEYDITNDVDGTLIVAHVRGGATDGTDRVRNFELLRFSDVIIPASAATTPPEDVTPPAPVGSLRLIAGDATVSLSWTNPSDAAGVLILRSTVRFASGFFDSDEQVAVYGGNGTSFEDTGLENGTTYYYTVYTWDAAGNNSVGANVLGTPEAEVGPDVTPPGPVTGLEVQAGNTRLTVTWTNPADAVAVRVLRSTTGFAANAGDTAGQVLVFEGPSTGFIDSGRTNGTTYFYSLFARDSAGNYSVAATGSGTPSTQPVPDDDGDDDGDDDDGDEGDDGDDGDDGDGDGVTPPPPPPPPGATPPTGGPGGNAGCSATGSGSLGAAFGLLALVSLMRRRPRLTRG